VIAELVAVKVLGAGGVARGGFKDMLQTGRMTGQD